MILSGQYAQPEMKQRFQREAMAIAKLDHPHIVSIFETGEHDGQLYFSMKLVEGTSLAQVMKCQPLRTTVEQLAKVALAMEYAHQQGVVHRDLKPGNILIDKQGEPVVTDFGLARQMEGHDATQTGAIVGTPSYMAPEQARGVKNLTAAVDVYAIGVMLYEALVGHPPFQGATSLEIIHKVLEQEADYPRRWKSSEERDLAAIVKKCLQKEPSSRYATARLLANDLQLWLRGSFIPQLTPWPVRLWRTVCRPARNQTWVLNAPETLRWFVYPSFMVCLLGVYWLSVGRVRLMLLPALAQTCIAMLLFLHVFNNPRLEYLFNGYYFQDRVDAILAASRYHRFIILASFVGAIVVTLRGRTIPVVGLNMTETALRRRLWYLWGSVAVVMAVALILFGPFLGYRSLNGIQNDALAAATLILPAVVLLFGSFAGSPRTTLQWSLLIGGLAIISTTIYAFLPMMPEFFVVVFNTPWYALGAVGIMVLAALLVRSKASRTMISNHRLLLEGGAVFIIATCLFIVVPFHDSSRAPGGFWIPPRLEVWGARYADAVPVIHLQTWLAVAFLIGLTILVGRGHRGLAAPPPSQVYDQASLGSS